MVSLLTRRYADTVLAMALLLHFGRQYTNISGLKTPVHGYATSADGRRFSKNAGDQTVARADEQFLPRDAMRPPYTSHGSVSVRLSQVGVISKRLNESSWFLACELPSTRPTLC